MAADGDDNVNFDPDFDLRARENDVLFMASSGNFPLYITGRQRILKIEPRRLTAGRKSHNDSANPWIQLSEGMNETIMTDFSRYLRKKKGKSGSGANDVVVDPKYEHILWLKTFIISRESSGNFKQPIPAVESTGYVHPTEVVSDSSEGSNDPADSGDSNDNNIIGVSTTVNQLPQECSGQSSSKEKIKKKWTKTESLKRKLEKTDNELEKTISSLNASIKQQQGSSTVVKKEQMDEDSLYCMSLASRLRKLDDRKKAVVRNSIEKMFLDIEFGYYNYPMQNTMQNNSQQPSLSSSQNIQGNYIWPSNPLSTYQHLE